MNSRNIEETAVPPQKRQEIFIKRIKTGILK